MIGCNDKILFMYMSKKGKDISLHMFKKIIWFSTVLCAFSCTNKPLDHLEEVDSYIQEYPDSALATLKSIDPTALKNKKEKALYSLLSAMAFDKNYIDTADISIITPALDWYEKHKNDDHWAASLFYAGRIHYNAGDYPTAFIYYKRAKEASNDIYWDAMATGHMSILYHQYYNAKEELDCCIEACRLWNINGDSLKIKQSSASLAIAYHDNKMDGKADSLFSFLCFSKNPYYPAFSQWADCIMRRSSPNYEEVTTLFEKGINNGIGMTTDKWYEYAYALHKCGKDAQSDVIIKQLSLGEESTSSCLWNGKFAKDNGDLESALAYEQKWKELSDSIIRSQLSQSIFKAQAENYKLKSEIEVKRAEATRDIWMLSILAMTLLLLLCYFYYRSKCLKRETDLSKAYHVAEKTAEMLELVKKDCEDAMENNSKSREQLANLRRQYANLYKEQFYEIGRMFDYYRSESEISRKVVEQHLCNTRKIIEEINKGTEGQKEFECRINNDLDNIMRKLRSDFPYFKESDFRFLSFVIVGFDATTRSIILNETPNNMRVKKARLLKKILNSKSENVSLYSCFLR